MEANELDAFYNRIESFIFVEDEPESADVFFIPGNRYPQMAQECASLYAQGYAPFVIPSGKYSVTEGRFAGPVCGRDRYDKDYVTEWEFLRDVLIKGGVPEEAVLKEDQATYTWQNALFSRQAADKAGIRVRKAILCCKACHARRCLLYYQRAFPEASILIRPVNADGITRQNWRGSEEGIDEVMGEAARIVKQFSLYM